MQPVLLSHEACLRVVYALEFTHREYQLQSPEEVHLYAAHYNWDNGDESMRRLIDHLKIDEGTVLLIYWRANPQFFRQYGTRDEVPDWTRSDYDLIKEIERRFAEGFYTQHKFHYDPRNDNGVDITQEGQMAHSGHPIPEFMFTATPGISPNWNDPYDALTEADWERLNTDIEADEAQEKP
jgi:hypothetical protein